MTDTPDPGRPPASEPPPPVDLAELARHTFRTAGALRGLVEMLETADWQPDGYDRPALGRVADAIHGLSLRIALGSADAAVLSELTGRNFKQIGAPFDAAAYLAGLAGADAEGAAGDQAGEDDPDAWRRGLGQWQPDNGWSLQQWADEARALREALGALGNTFPACLPGEPQDCGESAWSHYATYAAMLAAQGQIMIEVNLGADTPGGKSAHAIYHAELDQYRAEMFHGAPPPPGVVIAGDDVDEGGQAGADQGDDEG